MVQEYQELSFSRHKSWVQVRLMDLDKAFSSMSDVHKEAIFVVGYMGATVREAEAILDKPFVSIWRHYVHGLDHLARHMNGVA